MKRLIEKKLRKWKNSPRRKPLIVRGARQVGKTYSLQKFGRDHFLGLVTVDLEKKREWHQIFSGNLDVKRIISELELAVNAQIKPGRTLLFLDEIQSCPRALMALRYFYEDCPELHIVAAGSLLEFAFNEISFPVGRVQFLNMFPLTFVEYLWAIGREKAAEIILNKQERVADSTHALLLKELKTYFFVGGMPESVAAYIAADSILECFSVHSELCDSLRQDFPKYAPRVDPYCLDSVFRRTAQNVGTQIRYSRMAEGYANSTIKRSFDLLLKARVIKKVMAANPAGIPLGASASPKKFKALLLDIGLWQYLCGLKPELEYRKQDLLAIHQGAMAEQFVGQELLAAQETDLYYWARHERGSTAEVDFLITVKNEILPVEVKSGAAGRLRSMHMLLKSYPHCRKGLIFSTAPYSELPEQKLVFLPLYYAFGAGSGS